MVAPMWIRLSRDAGHLLLALALALLAGCAALQRGGRDGSGANPPPNLMQVPDAEPRVEPIKSGGPNKPYEVLGRSYVPLAGDAPLTERGLASWYGRKFHGRPTSNGEIYDMYAMTAAHKTMPLPSYARVRNPANGREIVVRVNDRGPFHAGRVIDLSYTAALKLGVLNAVAPVEVERLTFEAIRSGAWRGDTRVAAAPPAAATGAPAPTATATPVTTSVIDAAPLPAAAAAVDASTATEAVATPAAGPELSASALRPQAGAPAGFWMQLGAFRERDGALDFQRKVERELEWLAPQLAVFTDRELHKLQAGPYASRGEAGAAAERLRAALQLVPMIVERR